MKKSNIRWKLVAYDALILLAVDVLLLVLYKSDNVLTANGIMAQAALSFLCVFSARFVCRVYRQIWRYGGIQSYIRLLIVDGCAFFAYLALELSLPIPKIAFARLLAISCMNLLGALSIRMVYHYAYKCNNTHTKYGRFLGWLLKFFGRIKIDNDRISDSQKIKVAIIGAGRVGVTFAEDLLNNPFSMYVPLCFVDVNEEKTGKEIHGISVLRESNAIFGELRKREVQEIVFAIPNFADNDRKRLYNYYAQSGLKIKVYDYPVVQAVGGKRQLREFDIEELLFRKPITMVDEKTAVYYRNKVILITGGGGSIGSELCRQLAKMSPKQIIILDIYENSTYNVQQELRIAYGNKIDIRIEIVSITDKKGLSRVFKEYHPQIVIHAAAHKHVPLMEHNCIEAVENNVFGTKNLVDICEEYRTERFMMVSTDKAVNPTNVMGATKRMCEMIVQSASIYGNVKYSTTRFGNVLGSAGSVIPLFKKQIANGGPVTLTDKRMIRYFMTIPEASQLVLQAGAMADNGELFVLDMGNPVKIYDLAVNMIRLSGADDVQIIETGLRPGEKLYEELLIETEKLDKTDNSLIFIEHDTPLTKRQVDQKLATLMSACNSGSDEVARKALKAVVPTYRSPEEVNASVDHAAELMDERETALA